MAKNRNWSRKIRENLKNPTLIDNASIEYDSENNNNVEQTETFEVFFPMELWLLYKADKRI